MTNLVDPTDPKSPPRRDGKPSEGNSFSLACQCVMIMYACTAGYGAYYLWRGGVRVPAQYAIILGFPAMAGILFVVVSVLVPSLLAPRRLTFPLNLTLPIVYASLIFMTVNLFTSPGNSLIAPYEQLRAARFWTSPAVLGLVIFSQVVCLTALAMLKSEPVN